MSDRITVTSTELRDTAGDMRTAASTIGAELARLLGRVQTLTSSWQGQAASSFDGYYAEFNTNWSKCEQALQDIASMLDSSAESYDTTEGGIAGQFAG